MTEAPDEEISAARRRLASRLRQLRRAADLSGEELGNRCGWGQSKTSKIELGRTVPQAADVEAWADAVEASPEVRAELRELVRDALTATTDWRESLAGGRAQAQARVAQREASVSTLRVWQPLIVPGLLQVPGYAQGVFALGESLGPEDVPQAVRARMERQAILFDTSKRLMFLIGEAGLRWRPASVDVQLAQLDRVASLTTLGNVEIGVVPLGGEAGVLAQHGFVIFGEPGVDDNLQVSVETVADVLRIYDADKVALYLRRFERLREAALFGEDARAVLRRIAVDLSTPSPGPP
jgi:transcriptional regulator with XRE-family HTH domain